MELIVNKSLPTDIHDLQTLCLISNIIRNHNNSLSDSIEVLEDTKSKLLNIKGVKFYKDIFYIDFGMDRFFIKNQKSELI